MTTVQQVYEVMQRLAPPELAEHWDNPGLLVDCGGADHLGDHRKSAVGVCRGRAAPCYGACHPAQ